MEPNRNGYIRQLFLRIGISPDDDKETDKKNIQPFFDGINDKFLDRREVHIRLDGGNGVRYYTYRPVLRNMITAKNRIPILSGVFF